MWPRSRRHIASPSRRHATRRGGGLSPRPSPAWVRARGRLVRIRSTIAIARRVAAPARRATQFAPPPAPRRLRVMTAGTSRSMLRPRSRATSRSAMIQITSPLTHRRPSASTPETSRSTQASQLKQWNRGGRQQIAARPAAARQATGAGAASSRKGAQPVDVGRRYCGSGALTGIDWGSQRLAGTRPTGVGAKGRV